MLTLSDKINRLHNLYHPYNPVGVYDEETNPDGCREEWCTTKLPPLVEATVEAGEFGALKRIFKISSHNFRVAHVSQSKLQAIRSLITSAEDDVIRVTDITEILDV